LKPLEIIFYLDRVEIDYKTKLSKILLHELKRKNETSTYDRLLACAMEM